ncbi:hypothetical protein BD413DRAFT_543805, partial [Trametes elegans]
MLAQADGARAREELTLYKYRLEDAQREITRAQEIINELEQEKLEAEAEAARARSTARRYREQQLVTRAREEGRQEGFQEGFSRGRNMGYQEAVDTDDAEDAEDVEDRRFQKRPVLVEEVDDEEGEIGPSRYRPSTPGPDFRSRTPASDIRVKTPGPEMRARTPGPPGPSWRPPSRTAQSRASQRVPAHVNDGAHIAATLPIPTVATPLNLPSPSHSQAGTPAPSMPRFDARAVRDGDVPPPIPIREPIHSPLHPPTEIPPDGYIPYENASGEIVLPPPHELSRPVSPATTAPTPAVDEPPPVPNPSQAPPHTPNYIYANPNASASVGPSLSSRINAVGRPFSPQSKASTSISQFDLVSSRSKSRGARAREDRVPTSPRGPRPREDLPPIRPPLGDRLDTTSTSKSSESRSPTTPLERIFKRKYHGRPSKETVIPDIVVEAPSTPSTGRSSTKTHITHPHLLSPEHNPRPLAPQDDVVVMRMEIPGYHPTIPSGPYVPPHPIEDDDEYPVIPPPPDMFPPGFVPQTPPMRPGSSSRNPLPVPSNQPVPIPPNNPLPIPNNNPLPIPNRSPLHIPQPNPLPVPQSQDPLPIRQRIPRPSQPSNTNPIPVPVKDRRGTPVPIPHDDPLPIPQEEPLPVPHRSGTPSRYAEAAVPSGVVYPSPPSRRSRTPMSSVSSPPNSMRRGLWDMRSPGERLSPLPLHFFAHLRSDTNT